jgi:putative ABC transport system permease protein
VQDVLQNLRHNFRTLRKSPGPTATILLTIALGIGATTAIFTVDYATLLAPLPYPHPDRLVNVWSKFQGHRNFVSVGDLADWRRRTTVFERLETATPDNFNIATRDRPEYLEGMVATPGYNAMFGNQFFLGRNFLSEEGAPGKDHVVILTYRLWQHFGSDSKILGQTMRINGENYTVVGVLAPGTADRWGPESMVPLVFKPEQLIDHAGRGWVVSARLKPGVTIQQAQAEMDAIAAQEAKDFPKTNQGWGAVVEPFKNDFLPNERQRLLWLLLGAVGFLLLIACLNVANLLLAKSVMRQREVAIRSALGAQPSSIFAHFLTESLTLAIVGGTLGIAVGSFVLDGLVTAIPTDSLPPEADLRLNIPILLMMLAVATLAGVLFGCVPAVRFASGPRGSAQGWRSFGDWRGPSQVSPTPGYRRVRLSSAAAGRSRDDDSQLLESHAPGSRCPYRSRPGLLSRLGVAHEKSHPEQHELVLSPGSCHDSRCTRRLSRVRNDILASRFPA